MKRRRCCAEHDNFIILTHRRRTETPPDALRGCAGSARARKVGLGAQKPAADAEARAVCRRASDGYLPEDATVISVDIASLGLFSFDAEALHLEERLCFAIDHHGATIYRSRSSSTGQRRLRQRSFWELLELLGVTLTRQMAEALYLAISTDTGCFKYSNTTAHTHAAAATLIAAGAEVYPINKAFFDTKSFARLKLEARLTDSIELYGGGIVGLCTCRNRF